MPQLFTPRANFIAYLSVIALGLSAVTVTALMIVIPRTDYVRDVHVFVDQPVPFSHAHHVSGLGIDCRYCHQSVEQTPTAGMPATETCMHCHSQLWTQARLLEPVRESWRTGTPIAWNRVHDVPDFVFFDHSVHVNNGVSCYECHGRVDQMPLMTKKHALFMGWCLDCHRDPGPNLRPANEIVNLAWQPPTDSDERDQLAAALVDKFHIADRGLTDCITCHR